MIGDKIIAAHKAQNIFIIIMLALIALGIMFGCNTKIYAAEVDDLKRELSIIQLKISEEEARYQAAKAQMERAQIVAQYLFPDLRARERQLVEKIEKLNGQK